MATTQKLNLALQDDGAAQWGGVLNDNFNIIDSEFNRVNKLLVTTTLSSGLTSTILPPTVQNNSIRLGQYSCFFNDTSVLNNNRTISSTVIDLSAAAIPTGEQYINCYFGIYLNETEELKTWFATDIDTVKGYIKNPRYIYIGSIAKTSDGLIEATMIINPWFSDFTLSDRMTSFSSMGNVYNLNIRNNDNRLKCGSDTYYWEKEGINYTADDHHIKANFLSTNGGNIQFFRAVDNHQLDASTELTPWTEIDFKYFTNNILQNIPNNYYSIQRIGLLGNNNAVVFYGNKIYNNIGDLQNDLENLEPLNTFIRVKEVARMVISSNSILGIYNINSLDNALDIDKVQTSGIWPIYEVNTNELKFDQDNDTLSFIGTLFKKDNNGIKHRTLTEPVIFNNWNILDAGWNTVYIQYEDLQIDKNINQGIKLGYALINETNDVKTLQKWITSPQFCTTTEAQREEQNYNALKFVGMVTLGEHGLQYSSDAKLVGEGTNYIENANNYNIKDLSEKLLTFEYYDHKNNNILDNLTTLGNYTEQGDAIENNKYGIQKLLLMADGSNLIIGSKKEYDEKPGVEEIYQVGSNSEYYYLNGQIGIELARIVTGDETPVLYFSYINNAINSAVQIQTATYGGTITYKPGNGIVFIGDTEVEIGLDNTTVTPKSYGGVNTNVSLTIDSYGRVVSASDQPGISLTTSGSGNAIGSLSFNNNVFTASIINVPTIDRRNGGPEPNDTADIIIDETNHKIYIWDGDKYQLMNSWQG